MISIINASPRVNSNSSHFINLITKHLKEEFKIIRLYRESSDYVLENIDEAHTIILVFPLYVDLPPSLLINLMENYNIYNKKIYVVCNCGFLECKQMSLSIQIIENWCKASGGIFMGSFKIGAGEVLGHDSMLYILSPLFKHKIKKFTKYVNNDKRINLATTILLPKKLFCYFGSKSFKKRLAKYSKIYEYVDNEKSI